MEKGAGPEPGELLGAGPWGLDFNPNTMGSCWEGLNWGW